jgi:hypothetical protein
VLASDFELFLCHKVKKKGVFSLKKVPKNSIYWLVLMLFGVKIRFLKRTTRDFFGIYSEKIGGK